MSDIRAALLGRLPSGDGNGLAALASDLAKDPKRIRVGVILFDADRIVEKTDDGNHEARVRLRRVEAIQDPEDAVALQRILMRAFERRSGATMLPLELEVDVQDAFAGLDPQAIAEQIAREAAEEPVEHTGADESWADELAAMKDGGRPASCGTCNEPISWDEAGQVWQDQGGWPGGPGGDHQHAPGLASDDGDASPGQE